MLLRLVVFYCVLRANTADCCRLQWVKLINMAYRFEEVQYLRFEVYDADGVFTSSDASKLDLSKQVRQHRNS
jgi:hypothetical protein